MLQLKARVLQIGHNGIKESVQLQLYVIDSETKQIVPGPSDGITIYIINPKDQNQFSNGSEYILELKELPRVIHNPLTDDLGSVSGGPYTIPQPSDFDLSKFLK